MRFHIGIDLIKIRRAEYLISRINNKHKYFTDFEIEAGINHLVHSFSAKEALIKSYSGPKNVKLNELELRYSSTGQPKLTYTKPLQSNNRQEIIVSFSRVEELLACVLLRVSWLESD